MAASKPKSKSAPRKVAPVPQGYRTVTPYLIVQGADGAIEFYKQAFGATELSRLPGADGLSIAHAEIKIGNSIIMLSDEMPAFGILSPRSLGGTAASNHLYVEDVDSFWDQALEAGAVEVVALSNTFWGDRFGKVVDPFGHVWTIASRVEKLSKDELAERAAAAHAGPVAEAPEGDAPAAQPAE